jgi:potassium-transporting ATPase KdpC subunit
MTKFIRPGLSLFVLFTILFGAAYPALSTAVVKVLFPFEAEGSLITKDGKVLGSKLIGQNFSDPKYFWGRLSSTGPYAYNASASSGSNMGSANPALLDAVKGRIDTLKKADPENNKPIPVDLVTASGSGLDPHISPASAQYQLARVARVRGITENEVKRLINQYTTGRQFGILGEPVVNVLELNLALDGKI